MAHEHQWLPGGLQLGANSIRLVTWCETLDLPDAESRREVFGQNLGGLPCAQLIRVADLRHLNSQARGAPGYSLHLLASAIAQWPSRILHVGLCLSVSHQVEPQCVFDGHHYLRRYVPINSAWPRI